MGNNTSYDGIMEQIRGIFENFMGITWGSFVCGRICPKYKQLSCKKKLDKKIENVLSF